MIANIAARSTHRIGVGRTAAAAGRDVALVDAFHHQRPARLLEKLVVEPMHQAADLDAGAGLARHEPELGELLAARLAKVFGYDGGARYRRHALFDQNGSGARGIEHQKILTPLPGPLLDQPRP